MRKHNEGYALVLVLVVMVVLSIVAVSLMSMGLRNLKAQQAVGERMADKYAAQGEIEKLIAILIQADTYNRANEATSEGDHDKELSAWIKEEVIPSWLDGIPEDAEATAELKNLTITEDTVSEGEPKEGTYSGTITLKVKHGTAAIKCVLSVSGKYTLKNPEPPSTTYIYEIAPKESTYQEYAISRTAQGGEAQ